MPQNGRELIIIISRQRFNISLGRPSQHDPVNGILYWRELCNHKKSNIHCTTRQPHWKLTPCSRAATATTTRLRQINTPADSSLLVLRTNAQNQSKWGTGNTNTLDKRSFISVHALLQTNVRGLTRREYLPGHSHSMRRRSFINIAHSTATAPRWGWPTQQLCQTPAAV